MWEGGSGGGCSWGRASEWRIVSRLGSEVLRSWLFSVTDIQPIWDSDTLTASTLPFFFKKLTMHDDVLPLSGQIEFTSLVVTCFRSVCQGSVYLRTLRLHAGNGEH